MARRPLTKPRKHATQQRSRATVDALVEATARLLAREGFEKATTNRIADVAGVSIGSLYQYFPSKEALVAAVMVRESEETMRVVRDAIADVATLSLEEAVRRLVAVAIEAHQVDPNLHRVLSEEIPRTGSLEGVQAFNREIYTLFRRYMESHGAEIRRIDPEVAAFVCVTSIEAIAHTAVLHHHERVTGEGTKTLIDEATHLIVGYLRRPPG